jgi:hypothetical protein
MEARDRHPNPLDASTRTPMHRWRLKQIDRPDLVGPWRDTLEEARNDATRAGHARRHPDPAIGFVPHVLLGFEEG